MSMPSEDEELWGEIPQVVPCLNTFDQKKFLQLLQSMTDKETAVVGQQVFVPPGESRTAHWTTECPDNITMHTVQLQKFMNDMNIKIERDVPVFAQRVLHPCPEMPPLHKDCILFHKHPRDMTTLNPKKSDFIKSKSESPVLPFHIIRQQQDKALSALLVKIGFFSGKAHAFDVFMDVLHEFYLRITKLLRHNVDRVAMTGNSVFIDVLEKTFQQMGLGSIFSLRDFYNESVIDHHEHIFEKCKSLVNKHEKLRSARPKPKEKNILPILERPGKKYFSRMPILTSSEEHYAELKYEPHQHEDCQNESAQCEKIYDEPKGSNSSMVDSFNWMENAKNCDLNSHLQFIDFTDLYVEEAEITTALEFEPNIK